MDCVDPVRLGCPGVGDQRVAAGLGMRREADTRGREKRAFEVPGACVRFGVDRGPLTVEGGEGLTIPRERTVARRNAPPRLFRRDLEVQDERVLSESVACCGRAQGAAPQLDDRRRAS